MPKEPLSNELRNQQGRTRRQDVAPRRPRWVTAFMIVVGVLVVAVIVLHLTGVLGMAMHE